MAAILRVKPKFGENDDDYSQRRPTIQIKSTFGVIILKNYKNSFISLSREMNETREQHKEARNDMKRHLRGWKENGGKRK